MNMMSYDEERLQTVRVIESLRCGVPRRESTRMMPDVRSGLMDPIRRDLEAVAEGKKVTGRLIWGEYGQGKSHFLKAVEHLALDENFAVSFVSLSREVSCHNLFRFYQRVAPAVRTPDSEVPGLQKQLSKKRPSELHGTPITDPNRYPHPLPAVVLEVLLHGQMDEESYGLYHDLLGDRLRVAEVRRAAQSVGLADRLRKLPRFRMGDHAFAYFGVLADAIRFCGYRGWVILIDEVELVARLGKVSRLKAYLNLNWLFNWSHAMQYPIYTVAAAASSLQDAWRNETRRRPLENEAIPELARERLGPEAESDMRQFFEMASRSPPCLTLMPVPSDDLLSLLGCLVHFHGQAHGWEPPAGEEWVRRVTSTLREDEKVRTWLRMVLEALDVLMVSGETPQLQPGGLTEHSTEESESYSQDAERSEP